MKHFEKYNFRKANTFIRKNEEESSLSPKEELVRPLLSKKSHDFTFRPSKLANSFTRILYKSQIQEVSEINSFYHSFNNLTIKEHLKQEKNESSSSKGSDDSINTGIKSLMIYFVILILSVSQLFLYRTSFEYLEINFSWLFPRSTSNEFIKEVVFYSWRLQIILLILTFYFVICNLLSKSGKKIKNLKNLKNIQNEELTIKDNLKLNFIESKNSYNAPNDRFLNINFNDFFTFTNLRLGFYNLVASGLLYYSSRFLPWGFLILINNSNIMLIFLSSNNTCNYFKNFKIFVIVLLLISITLIMRNLLLAESLYGLLLAGLSLSTNIFFTQPLQKSCLEKNSPGNFLYILYFFSFVSSAFIVAILQFVVNEESKFFLFNWLTNYKVFLIIFLMIGIPNFFYLMTNISLSMNSYQLNYVKYLEIPMVDFLSLFLRIKLSLLNFVYFIGLGQVLICMLLVEYILMNGLKLKISKLGAI
jgi:hypothetical protein